MEHYTKALTSLLERDVRKVCKLSRKLTQLIRQLIMRSDVNLVTKKINSKLNETKIWSNELWAWMSLQSQVLFSQYKKLPLTCSVR